MKYKENSWLNTKPNSAKTLIERAKREVPDFNEPVCTLNPIMSSFAHTTSITVLNKQMFKQWIEFIDKPMMNHSVAKIGCEYFPLHRFVYNESDTAPKLIFSLINFIDKLKNILF